MLNPTPRIALLNTGCTWNHFLAAGTTYGQICWHHAAPAGHLLNSTMVWSGDMDILCHSKNLKYSDPSFLGHHKGFSSNSYHLYLGEWFFQQNSFPWPQGVSPKLIPLVCFCWPFFWGQKGSNRPPRMWNTMFNRVQPMFNPFEAAGTTYGQIWQFWAEIGHKMAINGLKIWKMVSLKVEHIIT